MPGIPHNETAQCQEAPGCPAHGKAKPTAAELQAALDYLMDCYAPGSAKQMIDAALGDGRLAAMLRALEMAAKMNATPHSSLRPVQDAARLALDGLGGLPDA